jgi:hypothetical protein
MAEGELEEAEAVGAAPLRFGLVGMAGEGGDHGDIGVHRVPDGHALLLERLVVVVHPLPRLRGIDEGEGEGADAELRRQMDGIAIGAGHPQRRVRLLHRLGNDIPRRHGEVLPLEAGIGIHHHHVGDLLHRLPPHGAPLVGLDAEALELRARGGLAGAPVHPAVGDQVQRGDALGDAGGRVVAGRHEHDPVAEPDALGPLRGGGEEHLGGGRVGVLLEEVMLHLPGMIDAQPVRQLHLVEGVLEQPQLGALGPGARKLVLVEDPELHLVPPAEVAPPAGAVASRAR